MTTSQPGLRMVNLGDLQPSQLYISREKLICVQSEFEQQFPQCMAPIPYKNLGGLWVMTDGHTRAFAAYLAGLSAVLAYPDPDDLDWEAYQICVDWCHAAEIYSIADLAGRLIASEDYERLWHDRCRAMQSDLAHKRKTR